MVLASRLNFVEEEGVVKGGGVVYCMTGCEAVGCCGGEGQRVVCEEKAAGGGDDRPGSCGFEGPGFVPGEEEGVEHSYDGHGGAWVAAGVDEAVDDVDGAVEVGQGVDEEAGAGDGRDCEKGLGDAAGVL